MAIDNSDLQVLKTDTFDAWRGRYNILAQRSSQLNGVGEISSLDPAIPTQYRDSLVTAINYVYNIRVSEGQPLSNSAFNNCNVVDQLNYGTAWFKTVAQTYGGAVVFGEGSDEYVWFTENGRLGIGTSDPQAQLHVSGNTETQGLSVRNPSTGRALTFSNITSGATNYSVVTSNSVLVLNQGGTATLMNQGGGKFGVGYATEGELVEAFNFKQQSSRAALRLESLNDSMTIVNDASGIDVLRGETRQLKILSNGNMGVGVDSPSYRLEVNGRAQATNLGFGAKLFAGTAELAEVTGAGQTTLKLTSGGTLTHGSTTIVDTDSKIAWSNIKGFSATTTDVTEGTNLYFTNARARTAVGSGSVSSLNVAATGTLVHGSTTIVDTDSKIAWSNIKGFSTTTTNVAEGTNLYFTNARALSAVGGGTVSNLSVSATGTLVHGSTTIVDTDSKIDFDNIKNFDATTTDVTEGINLYFTDARARSAVGSGTVTTVTISSLLKLPKYATASLPTGVAGDVAYSTTINLPVVHNGTAWVKFDGSAI